MIFSGSLVLQMRKVRVGSVNKILLVLAQSLYVVQHKRNTLTSTNYFFVTVESYCYRHFTITQSHMYVCMPFDYACRLLFVV